MRTNAVRLHGKNDLRLDEFELPPMKEDEILAQVMSDSVCMSSHKAALQGADHKRVPTDIDTYPTIIGHEFCGTILQVGKKWQGTFVPGGKFSIQPALNQNNSLDAPGYSYRFIGGDATYIIIPDEVMECGCLLPYSGEGYFLASLSEPVSCIIGAFRASYHTSPGSWAHEMGIVKGGTAAFLAGAGPMGIGAIDYALHGGRRPRLLAVTDIDGGRLERAAAIYTVEEATRCGVELHYINTSGGTHGELLLRSLTGGKGYDDIFVFSPVKPLAELADRLLARDGCLNFFAGPTGPGFTAEINLYNLHYAATHFVGTSGGTVADMREALDLMAAGTIRPALMVTHIGGLDSVVRTTLNLPDIPGGKKLIYPNIRLALTAIDDFERLGGNNDMFKELAKIIATYNGVWSVEAEAYLLSHAPSL
ncbi:MAG: zinc-binding dehydrogenase [Chitinispirillaceae bacterium]|nr:zinc-binding dehydrogenase [Chitinispirillaceae bacterium]